MYKLKTSRKVAVSEGSSAKDPNAVALGRKGGLKGGKVRTGAMTPKERSELGRQAAAARWGNAGDVEPTLPETETLDARAEEGLVELDACATDLASPRIARASHVGVLKIGNIPCAVLEDGRRVLTQQGFVKAIGRAGLKYGPSSEVMNDLPRFLTAANLKPFISEELRCSSRPIVFRGMGGGGQRGRALGYLAELLPRVCTVFLDARDANVLVAHQEHIARTCDLLIRGLATVGIVALVDEATGYQAERERDALHRILEAYIAKELLPWTKRFPDEFYKQMFRLRGWTLGTRGPTGPRFAAQLTDRLIYQRLPPGVLEELRAKNPPDENGRRKRKLHELLSVDTGHPHLTTHVTVVTAMMRGSRTWDQFDATFELAFPLPGDQLRLAVEPPTLSAEMENPSE